MKEGIKKTINVPILVRILLNPASGAYKACTEGTRKNFVSLSQLLWFSAATCGIILGSAIAKFGFENKPEKYVIAISFGILFYWLIDRLIIMSDANKHLLFLKRSRYFVALIFGLLNSILIDTFWFAGDVESSRQKEISSMQAMIQFEADSIHESYQLKKENLYKIIEDVASQMKSRSDSLIEEFDGRSSSRQVGNGPHYKMKHEVFKNDSLEFIRTNSLMMTEAEKYDSMIVALSHLTGLKKDNVPNEVSKGINHSLQLLEDAIWINGSFVNKIIAILILLGSMLLELLPLLGKFYYDLQEYFDLINSEKESSIVNAGLRKQNYITREAQRLNLQNQRIMSSEYADHVLHTLKDDMMYNEEMINATDEHLDFIEEKKNVMEKKWSKYYDEYVKPLFAKVFINFKRNSEKAFSKQKFDS